MIKVERKGGYVRERRGVYPCLKISNEDKRIVLFIGPKTGYEIFAETEPHGFLDYCTYWDEELFYIYDGFIELSNDL